MFRVSCINGNEALLLCRQKGCVRNHIVCKDEQCNCHDQVATTGHQCAKVTHSSVIQHLNLLNQKHLQTLQQQRDILGIIDMTYKQMRMALQQSQRRYDELKKSIGFPHSYLEFRANSDSQECWNGNTIYNLMDPSSDVIKIKQSLSDIQNLSQMYLTKLSAVVSQYTELILRNRLKQKSSVSQHGNVQQDIQIREFKDREISIKDIKQLSRNIKQLSIIKCISMGWWGNVDWSPIFKELANRKILTHLEFKNCGLTTSMVEKFKNMTQLQVLNLESNGLVNDSLVPLTKLINLKQLYLSYNNIDDKGVRPLTILRQLIILDVSHNKVTRGGVQQLRNAFPNSEIKFS